MGIPGNPENGHLHFPCWCGDEHLSAGEISLIALLAAGLTTGEVASTMFVSPHTVAHRLTRVLEKCVARNRTELVAKAYAAGVLKAGDWPPRGSGQSCLNGATNKRTDGMATAVPVPRE
jgi:DNA-binding CsgD family transcriptional regulator